MSDSPNSPKLQQLQKYMKTLRRFTRNHLSSNLRIATAVTLITAAVGLLMSATMTTPVSAGSAQAAGFYTRQIPLAGTSSPQTGDFTPSDGSQGQVEFAGQGVEEDGSPGPAPGTVVNRSLSKGPGKGASATSGKKAKSNPQLNLSFAGLNLYQQRYARGGNQFTVEPPDQGMCVGNGYVVEAVNDVLNVFNAGTGTSALPDNTATNIVGGFPRNVNHAVDLNSFFGYAQAVTRPSGPPFGPFVTDPSCLYDAATQRFFVIALTLNTNPATGGFTTVNHLDVAVSKTSNPTGGWNIYRFDVTNDAVKTGGINTR